MEQVEAIGDSGRALVLLDCMAAPGSIENLVCVDGAGRIVWRARLPTSDSADAYVSFQLTDNHILANSWSGHRVVFDPVSGDCWVQTPLSSTAPECAAHVTVTIAELIIGSKGASKAAKALRHDSAGAGRSAAEASDEAFHYAYARWAESISKNGLRTGAYASPNGVLSPLQAQPELALPPNRGLTEIKIRG